MYSPKRPPAPSSIGRDFLSLSPSPLPIHHPLEKKKTLELNSHALHRGGFHLAVQLASLSGVRPAKTTRGRSDLCPPTLCICNWTAATASRLIPKYKPGF